MRITIEGLSFTTVKVIKPKKHKFQNRYIPGMEVIIRTNNETGHFNMYESDNIQISYAIDVTILDILRAWLFKKSLGNKIPVPQPTVEGGEVK